ncbi:MAG TPA: septal ring lytic transglycosylase RlpA family protein [Egibacteraceae bacterium]|nr:septal ring lytic transglycosylase RlpA family protein [Egibacteraceae bacterium]
MVPLFARLGVCVLVAVLGFGLIAGEKDVALIVDGQLEQRTTHAATVGEFLERAGVAVGDHDELRPDPDTPLVHGALVELVHARELTLLVGATERRVISTSLTVEEVLAELGEGGGRRDVVRPARLTPVRSGMVVEVSTPVAITVAVDGAEHEVITDAPSVRAVLDGLGVGAGPDDRVTPALDAAPQEGERVVVQRVTVAEETREEQIGFRVVERPTADLRRGQHREVVPGEEGLREVVDAVVRVDGVEESRAPTAHRVVRKPRHAVVEVGTAASAPSPRPAPPPPAPVPAGTPRAEPQPVAAPAAARAEQGRASKYAASFDGEPTASGEPYDPEAMTAAHRTLPLGTRVTVTNHANGKSVTVRVNDRGPFVEGRVIDLSQAAFWSIGPRGAGILDVRLEW